MEVTFMRESKTVIPYQSNSFFELTTMEFVGQLKLVLQQTIKTSEKVEVKSNLRSRKVKFYFGEYGFISLCYTDQQYIWTSKCSFIEHNSLPIIEQCLVDDLNKTTLVSVAILKNKEQVYYLIHPKQALC